MDYLLESNLISKPSFTLVGPQIRTQNVPGKADQDIPKLWGQVINEELLNQITAAKSEVIYALYSEYDGGFMSPYNCLIGKEVSSSDAACEGMVTVTIPEQTYHVFKVKGPMPQAILETWQVIWQKDAELKRTYTYDFEVYNSPDDVDIYISTR